MFKSIAFYFYACSATARPVRHVLVCKRFCFSCQYYRIISAALLHGGLMHIMFNMMSFLSIGSNLVGTAMQRF